MKIVDVTVERVSMGQTQGSGFGAIISPSGDHIPALRAQTQRVVARRS